LATPEFSVHGNRLLDALPSAELQTLVPNLSDIKLRKNDPVYQANEIVRFVYFPVRSLISALNVMEDGAAIEVTTVGPEGMSFPQAALGAKQALLAMVVQVPGRGYYMPTDEFRQHIDTLPRFRACVHEHMIFLFRTVARSAACNRLHHLTERCARWLLINADSTTNDTFPMTQEFLSMMLGVNRPSLTLAARTLQNAGFIATNHGSVTIRDRPQLEGVACECYREQRKDLAALYKSN
jgi:CRP-like cAMP-binding protein